jgi:hypothetical protein
MSRLPKTRCEVALARAIAVALALVAAAKPAAAEDEPPAAERRQVYSPYEQETIREVLDARGATQDPHPEGKIIEQVEVVPLEVFEKRDLQGAAPEWAKRWANSLHVTTRPSVVRDEVLLREGEPYREALVDDTIRNLRRLPGVPQLSVVLVVAARGSTPDQVVFIVITKDVWSLRLNWNAVGSLGGLDRLEFLPAETNFLGTHQVANLHFVLEPGAYTFGAGYLVPRIEHSRIAVSVGANVMVNRQSGKPEGTYGSLVTGAPLFSGSTEWAWDASAGWSDYVFRQYSNGQTVLFTDPAVPEHPLPFQYRVRGYSAVLEVTRSFGWDINHDFTLAANVSRSLYQTEFSGADPQVVADFVRQLVPVSDTWVGPALQYHTYEMRFLRVINVDTLALQEDYRLGHDVVFRVSPGLRALGGSRDVLGLYGAVQYTWALRDGLARISFQSTLNPEAHRIADAAIEPTIHLVSPTIPGFGRVVLGSTLLWRWRDYLNTQTTLGGDDRLRGYPTNFFVGRDWFSYNVEFRTRPVEILSSELGAVAFFDVGTTLPNLDHLVTYQSLGAGLRAVFPWLDRDVFRFDFGVPLERPLDPLGQRIPPFAFLFSFAQAFTTPTVAPAPALPTGQGPDSP